jgi:hypothetical protein
MKKHKMNLHLAELNSWFVIYFMISGSEYKTCDDRMIVNEKQFERK